MPSSCMLDAMARYFCEVRKLEVMVRKGTILLSSMVRKPGLNAGSGRLIALTRFLRLVNSRCQSLGEGLQFFCLEEFDEMIIR